MARFTLTIDFDDPLSETEGPVYAQLAASGAVHALKNTTIRVENVELVDHEAPTPSWQGGEGWLEWCQMAEAEAE